MTSHSAHATADPANPPYVLDPGDIVPLRHTTKETIVYGLPEGLEAGPSGEPRRVAVTVGSLDGGWSDAVTGATVHCDGGSQHYRPTMTTGEWPSTTPSWLAELVRWVADSDVAATPEAACAVCGWACVNDGSGWTHHPEGRRNPSHDARLEG